MGLVSKSPAGVIFLITVTKMHDKSHLRVGELILAHSSGEEGMASGYGAAGHAVSTVRKQRKMNVGVQLISPFYLVQDPINGVLPPRSGWGFPSQLTQSRISCMNMPRGLSSG